MFREERAVIGRLWHSFGNTLRRLLFARHVLPAIGTVSLLEIGWLILIRILHLVPNFDRLAFLQSTTCGVVGDGEDHIRVVF